MNIFGLVGAAGVHSLMSCATQDEIVSINPTFTYPMSEWIGEYIDSIP